MLTQANFNRINNDPDLLKAVTKVLEEYKKKNPMILTPDDLAGVWDVYLEGVLINNVYYIDLENRMLRRYTEPLTVENGQMKYVEMYGKINLQKRISV